MSMRVVGGTVALRRAVSADASAVTEVWLRSRREAARVGSIPPPAHSDAEVRGYLTEVAIPVRETWLAEVSGGVVAVMVLDGVWLNQLYVDPTWTGQGIGSDLIEQAKAVRPDGLQLWCFVTNTGAQRFYRRHGFVAVEATDGSANEEQAPDLRFTWTPGG